MNRHHSISSLGALALTIVSIWGLPRADSQQLAKWIPVTQPSNLHARTPSHLEDALAVVAPLGDGAAAPANTVQQGSPSQVPPSQVQPSQIRPSQVPPPAGDKMAPGPQGSNADLPWAMGQLRVRVVDGRSQRPLQGAEVVIVETEQRLTTGPDGYTPYIDVPVFRNPRLRPIVAELHGQLAVIAYKNGYRDSIHMGIRMHEGLKSESTVWMYKLGPGDDRIEPVLYQVPYHHLWLVELAERFRSKTQPGEGPQHP